MEYRVFKSEATNNYGAERKRWWGWQQVMERDPNYGTGLNSPYWDEETGGVIYLYRTTEKAVWDVLNKRR